jgi:hypothetical protein
MSTPSPRPPQSPRARRSVVWAITLAAGLIGLAAGFDFGNRLAGMLIGVVMAFNGALFCSILAAAVAERMFGERSSPSANQPERRGDA